MHSVKTGGPTQLHTAKPLLNRGKKSVKKRKLYKLVRIYGRAQTKEILGEGAIDMPPYNPSDPHGPPLTDL